MRIFLTFLAAAVLLHTPLPTTLVAPAGAEATVPRGVPYVTQRNRTGDPDPERFYGPDRGTLEAGHCGISERPLSFLGPLADTAPFHIPEEILSVSAVRPAPMDEVLDKLEHSAAGRAPVLYTHGFFIDFEKGCRRATILKENAALEGRLLWFSWPSDGDLLNYTRDEADLSWSVFDLAEIVLMLEARFGSGEVNLMGHSLGARGLVMAINDIAAQRRNLRLGHVILLAPDIDFDIFARLLPRIRPIVRSITVYVAEDDRPLALSEQVHGYPRLGQSGNDVSRLDGVDVIDLSDLPVRSPTGHLYHIYNEEVGADIAQKLNEGLDARSRRNLLRTGENLWQLKREP